MTTRDQITWLRALALEELIALALCALHSLNRRAKTYSEVEECPGADFSRGVIRRRIATIYGIKDGFLDALVRADRATVAAFPALQLVYRCGLCGRRLPGREAACWGCDDDDVSDNYADDGYTAVGSWESAPGQWYLVSVTGTPHQWHVPPKSVTPAIRDAAVQTEGEHDPRQPEREVPPVGVRIGGRAVRLTVAAQRAAVEAATSALLRSLTPDAMATGAEPKRELS